MSENAALAPPFAMPTGAVGAKVRIEAAVRENYEFLWRSLRRLGVSDPAVEDALQKVFIVFTDRIDHVSLGCEGAFLFATVIRVAADWRKKAARSREVADEHALRVCADVQPSPEGLLDQHRARALLDEAIGQLPMDLRTVFVLAELEEMTAPEIAALVGIPVGTAASRLRRARASFVQIAAQLRERQEKTPTAEGEP